ncbi:MAG: hypothetical protein EPO64_08500 [Nitrospirae bacterium]|nr:MAG: hypothetical protein EPO64_08500 [Nitrospirota bacterium]
MDGGESGISGLSRRRAAAAMWFLVAMSGPICDLAWAGQEASPEGADQAQTGSVSPQPSPSDEPRHAQHERDLTHFHKDRAHYQEGTTDTHAFNWPDGSIRVLKKTDLHLDKVLGVPEWLHIGLHQRTRYETLDQPFQKGQVSGEHLVALQTLPSLGIRRDAFRFFAEMIDARVYGSSDRFVTTNSFVDKTDILQLYGGLGTQNFLETNLHAEATFGRQTFDFGSRRLIGRNQFRNTVNAFDGLHVSLGDDRNWQVRAFVVAPVQRLTAKPDTEARTLFWGAFLGQRGLKWAHTDLYLYFLEDEVKPGAVPGLQRSLLTPGFRLFKEPATGEVDYEVETVWQVGRAALVQGGPQLQKFAYFQHVQMGYTFDLPWKPQLLIRYDYASGNHDPNGNKDGRFDTLYGPTNFELNPTGAFEVFARSNISSPAWRLAVDPSRMVRVTFQHRVFWLAQSQDQWINTGLQDPTGRAGNFLGHFFEARGRWLLSSNFSLEPGWCYLAKGSFISNLLAAGAPGTPNDKNANYVYVQGVLNF